jgi:LAS superfamily LD-carboxypeptidase LdcB
MKKLKLSKRKLLLLVAAGVVVVTLSSYGVFIYGRSGESQKVQETAVQEQKAEEKTVEEPVETTPAVVEDKKPTPPVVDTAPEWPVQLSSSEAASLTVVVNKKHKLPSDYAPDLTEVTGGQMRPEAAQAMTSLLFKANEASVPMKVISSYRSYSTQVSTYNKWVSQSGQADADRYSARPGHSEHQTGLAADLGMPDGSCNLEICFGSTAQGKWLATNAASYGFIIRYESDTESKTGYQYEPWHVRYVGVDTAKAIVNSGQTLDEYYGVTAGGY